MLALVLALALAFVIVVVHLGEQTVGLFGGDLPRRQLGENIAASATWRGGDVYIAAEPHRLQRVRQARLYAGIGDAEHILDILDSATATEKYLDELKLLIVEPRQPPKALVRFASGGGRAIPASGWLAGERESAFQRAATAITTQA